MRWCGSDWLDSHIFPFSKAHIQGTRSEKTFLASCRYRLHCIIGFCFALCGSVKVTIRGILSFWIFDFRYKGHTQWSLSDWKLGRGFNVSYWPSCLGQVSEPFNSLSCFLYQMGIIVMPPPQVVRMQKGDNAGARHAPHPPNSILGKVHSFIRSAL